MSVVLRAVGTGPLVIGGDRPVQPGDYLVAWDVDEFDGFGYATWSPNLAEAHHFPDGAAALQAWVQQSTVRPLRPDGKPNKPLTAISVEAVLVGKAHANDPQ